MFRRLALGVSCLAPFLLSPVHAQAFSSAGSGANATSVHLSAAGTVVADATTAPVSGTAPPAYDRTGGLASINQNFTLASGLLGTATQGLQTGVVSTRAFSDGTSSATGSVNLTNVNSVLANKLLGDLVPTSALGLAADAISSTTTAGIDASGNFFGFGSSSITNLGITGTALGALTIDGSLLSNPSANTVVLSLAGLMVTLNEQVRNQTSTGLFLQTNAVHIALSNYSLAGKLISGDVILGHSEAQVAGAVPEPATWAMMLAGFGVVGFAMRRRRPDLALA